MRTVVRRSVAILVVQFAMGAAPLVGQEEVGSDYVQLANEYFLTDAVYPQERGELQVTTFPLLAFDDGSSILLPLSLEYGITDRLQLELEWDAYGSLRPNDLPRTSGTGNVELEMQYSLMNVGGSRSHVAFGLGVTLPSGDVDDGLTEGLREYEPRLVVARDGAWGSTPWQLFGQASLGFVDRTSSSPGEGEEDANEASLGMGATFGFGRSRLILEGVWAGSRWDGGDEAEAYLSSGLVWDLPGTWEAGVAAQVGVTGDSEAFSLAFVLLYEFELFEDDSDADAPDRIDGLNAPTRSP